MQWPRAPGDKRDKKVREIPKPRVGGSNPLGPLTFRRMNRLLTRDRSGADVVVSGRIRLLWGMRVCARIVPASRSVGVPAQDLISSSPCGGVLPVKALRVHTFSRTLTLCLAHCATCMDTDSIPRWHCRVLAVLAFGTGKLPACVG